MVEKSVEELLKEQRKMLKVHHMQQMAAILNELRNQYGEGVFAAVDKVQGDLSRQNWGYIAKEIGSNTIEDLIKVLWEPMKQDGLEYTMEKTEEGIQMRCTKCPIYDLAKEHGYTELAYHINCTVDPHIAEGFNPKIGFRRTKTLMEGHDCCDHFYFIKE